MTIYWFGQALLQEVREVERTVSVDIDAIARHLREAEEEVMGLVAAVQHPPRLHPGDLTLDTMRAAQMALQAQGEMLGINARYAVRFVAAPNQAPPTVGAVREAAIIKSQAYMKRWLSAQQWAEWDERDYFHVTGNVTGKRYRIHNACVPHNIAELDEKGSHVARLCFVPMQRDPYHVYPPCDVAVMQKLLLEHDEAEALRIANRTPVVPLTMQSMVDAIHAMAAI